MRINKCQIKIIVSLQMGHVFDISLQRIKQLSQIAWLQANLDAFSKKQTQHSNIFIVHINYNFAHKLQILTNVFNSIPQ